MSPDEEIKMFKRLAKKLEDEKKGFEEERKKMVQQKKRFCGLLVTFLLSQILNLLFE